MQHSRDDKCLDNSIMVDTSSAVTRGQCFRHLARDDERLPATLAGLHFLAFNPVAQTLCGTADAECITRSRVGGCHWTDAEIADALDTSPSTVHRVRQA
jgi:hypothetical protein